MSPATAPAIMMVYFGHIAEGELEDHGPGDIRAWVGVGDEREPLGTYPTRREAMRAVSSIADAGPRLTEPAPWASGLPSR
jgi:hypothetical protein